MRSAFPRDLVHARRDGRLRQQNLKLLDECPLARRRLSSGRACHDEIIPSDNGIGLLRMLPQVRLEPPHAVTSVPLWQGRGPSAVRGALRGAHPPESDNRGLLTSVTLAREGLHRSYRPGLRPGAYDIDPLEWCE